MILVHIDDVWCCNGNNSIKNVCRLVCNRQGTTIEIHIYKLKTSKYWLLTKK